MPLTKLEICQTSSQQIKQKTAEDAKQTLHAQASAIPSLASTPAPIAAPVLTPVPDSNPNIIAKALTERIKGSAELLGMTIFGLNSLLKPTDHIPDLISAHEIAKIYREIEAQFAALLPFFISELASIILVQMQEAVFLHKPMVLCAYVFAPLSTWPDKKEWLRRTFSKIGDIATIGDKYPRTMIRIERFTNMEVRKALLIDYGRGLNRSLKRFLVDEEGHDTPDPIKFVMDKFTPSNFNLSKIFMVAESKSMTPYNFQRIKALETKQILLNTKQGMKHKACIERLQTHPELLERLLDSLDAVTSLNEFEEVLDSIMSVYSKQTQQSTFFATKKDNSTTKTASANKGSAMFA